MENNEQNTPQEQPDCPDSTQGSSRAKVLKTAIFVVVLLAVGAFATHSFIAGNSPCSIFCGAKSLSAPCPSTVVCPAVHDCPLIKNICTKEKACSKKTTCPQANQTDKPDLSNPDATAPARCPKTSAEK